MDSVGRGKISVLHVDDEPDVSELAATYLERESEDLEVTTASSPNAALDVLDTASIDCVVSDYDMPEMDGLAFLDAVREQYPDLPFILFTGKGSEEIASDAISAGVTDYLQKQVGTDQYTMLANRVRNAVEHYRTESALRESEERYRTVVERSHDGIYIYQGEQFIFVNDRACEISGYDEDELYDMNIWALVHEDDHARIKNIAKKRAMGEHSPSTYEARVVTKNDEIRHCEFSVQSITHDGEHAVLGSVRDITERRQAERRFKALIDQSTDILTVLDADGDIRYRSGAVEELLGYEQQELVGESAFGYMHPEDRDAVRAEFQRCLENPDYEAEATYRWKHKDGSWRVLESRARNHLDDPAIEGIVINSRDVTERQQAEQWYQALISNSTDILTVIDPDGTIRFESDSVESILGYDPEELVGESVFEYIHPDDQETVVETLQYGIENPESDHTATYRWRHADGDWRILESRGQNHLDDPAVEGLVINSRDVTARQEAQSALEAERNLTDSALDALDNIFFVLSPDGEFVRWSDKLKETTGYTAEEIDELPAETFVRDEDSERISSFIEAVIDTGQAKVEVDLLTKGGETIPHESHGVRLTDDDDELVGVCGIATDVTERKRRERDLAFFKQAVERVGIGVGIYDESGRFEYVNGHYAELLGTTREELLGTGIWEFATEYDRDDYEEFWDSFEDGETQVCETNYKRFDGGTVPGEGVTTRTEIHGEAYNIETVRDITERKARERELQRQNDYLQEFASIVSHDLKNPLNVAEGRMGLAKETGDTEHFEAAERAHDRIGQIIDDLLLLAQQGQAVDSEETVDVERVCEAAWTTTDTGEAATLSLDDLDTVEGDPERLRQMFENLFGNAVEHSLPPSQESADGTLETHGEHVSVSVGQLEDEASEDSSDASGGGFYVADDGPGIPVEDRETVFEHGYSTGSDGTGFGLSIVEEIVEAHGWSVSVTESAEGGARFEIRTAGDE
ncbi:PAS domain S-box protein [Halorussus halophilus]|uniref:PAS domain S-box protein n=1 Tax=Halorussus halophilus TaxID=2650975 RepID=UPI0013015CC0|nr:PAS domain S-box protein [Halorussus halophilus]